jgi:hypothetical protein
MERLNDSHPLVRGERLRLEGMEADSFRFQNLSAQNLFDHGLLCRR